MKMKLLQKKGSPLATMFTAVVIACLGLTQRGEAAVTWLVSQVGDDVVLVTSGDLMLPGGGYNIVLRGDVQVDIIQVGVNDGRVAGLSGEPGLLYNTIEGIGVATADVTVDAYNSAIADSVSGFFGHRGSGASDLYLPVNAYSGSAVTITPVVSMTLYDVTIAGMFGNNLDNGPVSIWTANVTGDTIQIDLAPVAVPEPSSTALLGLGGLALMLRRRR